MEIHHIDQNGGNDEDNGIPLCFDCHAEVLSYNDQHPKGRKFTISELKQHKFQWFSQVKSLTFIDDKEMDEGIDEFPPDSGLYNLMSYIIENYSKIVHHKQDISLFKDRVGSFSLFILLEIPIFYSFFNNYILSKYLNWTILSAILGFFFLLFGLYIENTRCEVCNNAGGLTIFDSKLIDEKVRETKEKIVTDKTYNVVYKCKVCGVVKTKKEKYKNTQSKDDKE
jgi:hypothetical protein